MYIMIHFDNGTIISLEKDEAQEILDLMESKTSTTLLVNNNGIQMMQPTGCFINVPSRGYINLNHVVMISVFDDEPEKEEEVCMCTNCKYKNQSFSEEPCSYCDDNSQWEAQDEKN